MMDRHPRSDCHSVLEAAPATRAGLIHSSRKKLALGGTSPRQSRKPVHIPIKHSKRQLFLGCLSQSGAQAARFPASLSLPLAVGRIKLLEKSV